MRAQRNAADISQADSINGIASLEKSICGARCERTSRLFGPATAKAAPFVGDIKSMRGDSWANCLQQKFNIRKNARGMGGCCRYKITMLAEPSRRAVVKGDSIVAQHYAVARAADRQRAPIIRVDYLQQVPPPPSVQFNFAERGNIKDAGFASR